MDISAISDDSIFVFFGATGQSFEFGKSHFADDPALVPLTTSEKIKKVESQIAGFMAGTSPFTHLAPNGVISVITPGPGISLQILPGSVFKSFLRNMQIAQQRQQLGLVQANH